MARGIAPRSAWRRGDRYDYLRTVERPMFAWEWLRRTARYRRAYLRANAGGAAAQARLARAFGLVELPSPRLSAAEARPVWRVERDPSVIAAAPLAECAANGDRFDIRTLAALAWVGLDDEDIEHWRIGTAARSIRLDIHEGTLLGGPTPLRFDLSGLDRLRPKLVPLAELVRLDAMQRLQPSAREPRAPRWIAELRTADALGDGASQHEIASALFGAVIPDAKWRSEGESYRLRVQRLVRSARARLADPLSGEWFG